MYNRACSTSEATDQITQRNSMEVDDMLHNGEILIELSLLDNEYTDCENNMNESSGSKDHNKSMSFQSFPPQRCTSSNCSEDGRRNFDWEVPWERNAFPLTTAAAVAAERRRFYQCQSSLDMSTSSSFGARSSRPTLRNLNPMFHKRDKSEDEDALPPHILKQARKTGILKFSGKGLFTVPDKIYDINERDKDVEVTLDSLVAKEEDAWWNQTALTNLDLSSNCLSQLSPKIGNLYSLTTLTLHDNVLSSIPKEIAKLEKLTRINLSRNDLDSLPDEFFTLPELRYLNISNNRFEELHPDISDLHMLEFLDASHNKLQSIPCGIGFLVRVTELILSHNNINELPPDLVDMRCLRKLDLTYNDITALPENMGCLRKLECLYIRHNDITELPTFDGCESLQELHAANNFIESIPSRLCSKLLKLKILDLRDNKITKIPDEIELLTNLTRLDLTNNSIHNLPCSLASLANLVSLQIHGNPIKSIRRDILQCGTTRILKTLRDRAKAEENNLNSPETSPGSPASRVLVASGEMGADGLNSPRRPAPVNGESIFPDKYNMRNTRALNVTMQNLTDVPDNVFLEAVKENVARVDMSKNRLETVPAGLQILSPCVSEVIFANNLLCKVPAFFSQFTRLSLLNLSCNNLTELPKELGVLNTLRELNICNNRFESIPCCVYDMQNLEILLASDNRIRGINAGADGLGALKRLARLDLRNNNIEQVPPILGNLRNIITLELFGNPFRQPRHQIIVKGTEAVMSYLRDRIPS